MTIGHDRFGRGVLAVIVALALACALPGRACAQDPAAPAADVRIDGHSAPDNPLEFEWTIDNGAPQPIVRVQFHHFLGKDVFPPAGWVKSKMTGNIGINQKRELGVLEFSAEKKSGGIHSGGTQNFRVRLDTTWTRYVTPQTVEVEFADGKKAEIHGVFSPAQAPFLRDNYPVVGLGSIFIIFIIASAARRKRRRRMEESAQSGA